MHVIRTMIRVLAVLTLLLALPAQADDWLVDADDDTRAERLSSYLGGFSSARHAMPAWPATWPRTCHS